MSELKFLSEEMILKAQKLGVDFKNVEESFVRGSGKGGQKVNKTSSCVLLRDLKSGVEVRCQKFREQSANREYAYKLLLKKIEEKILGRKSEIQRKIYKLIKQKKKRSKRAKEKMIDDKKFKAGIKENRRKMF